MKTNASIEMTCDTLLRMHFIELQSYRNYRPSYPKEIYSFSEILLNNELNVLELGSGTGISIDSLLFAHSELKKDELKKQVKKHQDADIEWITSSVTAIDEDQECLNYSKTVLNTTYPNHKFNFICEKISDESLLKHFENSLETRPFFDFIQIASSFHWFHEKLTPGGLSRLLKPGGVLFIHEYQFPKSSHHLELNEFIKKSFNLKWRTVHQKPRGSLKELTTPYRKFPQFKEVILQKTKMEHELDATYLSEHLFSQSRYLAYEQTLSMEEKESERKKVFESIDRLMNGKKEVFDFNWKGYLFLNQPSR